MTRKFEITKTLDDIQKNINELKVCAEDLLEMCYDAEKGFHNYNSIEYTYAVKIIDCAIGLEIQLKAFRISTSIFGKFSKKFTEDLEKLEKETHSEIGPCQLVGIIIGNLLIALTGIGALIFAGKAIYAATTKEGFNPHSIFYGTRKAHEQKIHDLKSDLEKFENLLPTSLSTKVKTTIN